MASLKRRGNKYYAQYYVAGKQRRVTLDTDSYQIAKEKVRQIESAFMRGADIPLPTKTPIAEIVAAYVEHISTTKSPRGVRADVFYLRDAFGPIQGGGGAMVARAGDSGAGSASHARGTLSNQREPSALRRLINCGADGPGEKVAQRVLLL